MTHRERERERERGMSADNVSISIVYRVQTNYEIVTVFSSHTPSVTSLDSHSASHRKSAKSIVLYDSLYADVSRSFRMRADQAIDVTRLVRLDKGALHTSIPLRQWSPTILIHPVLTTFASRFPASSRDHYYKHISVPLFQAIRHLLILFLSDYLTSSNLSLSSHHLLHLRLLTHLSNSIYRLPSSSLSFLPQSFL